MRIEATTEARPSLDEFIEQSFELLETANWVIEFSTQKFLEIEMLDINDDEKNVIRSMMVLKAIHTWDVVVAMWDISQESEGQERLKSLLALAYTHDVARFLQAQLGTFHDAKTFDHAVVGEGLYQKYIGSKKIWKQQVIIEIGEAIKLHNQRKVKKSANPHVLSIRDADKLALFRRAELYVRKDYKVEDKERSISISVYETFMAEKPISVNTLNTEADLIVFRLAWIFDLNSQKARSLIVEEGHLDFMMAALHRLMKRRNKQTLDIYAKIDQWKQKYNLFSTIK